MVNGSNISIGGSVGITMFPADAAPYEDLLVNADLAMYAAKNKGRSTYMFYTPELASSARERSNARNELREAIKKRALSVHYQPKSIATTGASAVLRRWSAGVTRSARSRPINSSRWPRKPG